MSELDPLLRDKVPNLGQMLGQTIEADCGSDIFELIERIRNLSKRAHNGSDKEKAELIGLLKALKDDELVPVARGFSQFLNLANIAEQQHTLSWRRQGAEGDAIEGILEGVLERLSGVELNKELKKIDI